MKVPSALAIGDFHPNSQTLLPKDFRSCQNAALQWVKNQFISWWRETKNWTFPERIIFQPSFFSGELLNFGGAGHSGHRSFAPELQGSPRETWEPKGCFDLAASWRILNRTVQLNPRKCSSEICLGSRVPNKKRCKTPLRRNPAPVDR